MPDPWLEIQRFLIGGGTLEQLKEEKKLAIVEDEDGRVMFNYDQIDSPRDDEICKESRGLILKKGSWEVVAAGFKRFFNHDETLAAFDLKTLSNVSKDVYIATTKLDGSYVSGYYFDGEWRFSTRGSIRASGSVGDYPFTFHDLIGLALKKTHMPACIPEASRNLTFIFELTSKYNKIVTPYDAPELTLIGIRNNETGYEYPTTSLPAWANIMGVAHPTMYSIGEFNDVLKLMQQLRPVDEGFVVALNDYSSKDIKRIKIKSISYVALHHLKSSDSLKNLATILLKGEEGEVYVHMPEYRDVLIEGKKRMNDIASLLDVTYAVALANSKNEQEPKLMKKRFAEIAINSKYSALLFEKYKKPESSFTELISKVKEETMVEWLELEALQARVLVPPPELMPVS